MNRILFVDDEKHLLDGLRRLFHPMRAEWHMSFVGSGLEALELLTREPFDVIVTDIRMPGMDGTQLLTRVRDRYPDMVRIVLSGHADQDLTLKATTTAHQYLSKPCDAAVLKLTIARAFALKNSLAAPSLQVLVAGATSLPSIPSIYLDLVRKLDYPDTSIRDVASVISHDTAMTAKVLQLANSAFFGIRRHIVDPKDAVLYLGFDVLKALALSVKVFSQFKPRPGSRFSIEALTQHGLHIGILSRKIASEAGASNQDVENSFMAGLLHDVGQLIIVDAMPDMHLDAADMADDPGVRLWEAERRVFATTHAEVGGYLLGLWGLPDSVVDAVAYHHEPSRCAGQRFSPLTAVHVANALGHERRNQSNGRASDLDIPYLENLNLGNKVAEWRSLIDEASLERMAV